MKMDKVAGSWQWMGERGWSSLYENHTPVCMIFIQSFFRTFASDK